MKAAGYHRALEELARRWAAGDIAARVVDDVNDDVNDGVADGEPGEARNGRA
jgi:hypothetical protein